MESSKENESGTKRASVWRVIHARRAVESGQFVLYEFVPCIIFDRHLGMPIHITNASFSV